MSRTLTGIVAVVSSITEEPIEGTLDLYRPVRDSLEGAPTDVWLPNTEQHVADSFEVSLVEGEDVAVRIRAVGYRPSDWTVTRAGEWIKGPVVIRLDPIPAISGKVVDRSGCGIGRVRIVSRSTHSFASSYSATTSEDGSFRVGVSFGNIRVAVEDEHWSEVVSEIVSEGGFVILATYPRAKQSVGTTATWEDGMPVQVGTVELRRVESGWKVPAPAVLGEIRNGAVLPLTLVEGEYEVLAWSIQPAEQGDVVSVVTIKHELGRCRVKALDPQLMPIVLPRGATIRCEASKVAWRGLTAEGNAPTLQLMSKRGGSWERQATHRMREGDVVVFSGVAPGEYGVLAQPSNIVHAVKVRAGETAMVALGASLAATPLAVFDRGLPVARCTVLLASTDGKRGAAADVHPGREAVAALPTGTQWVARISGPGLANVLATPRMIAGALRIDLAEGSVAVEGFHPPSRPVRPRACGSSWMEWIFGTCLGTCDCNVQ